MNKYFLLSAILIFFITVFSNCSRQNNFPVLKGPYLGQKPPGMTPDGKYFFFTTNKSGNRDIFWVDAKILFEKR